jgi:hypothetical protein
MVWLTPCVRGIVGLQRPIVFVSAIRNIKVNETYKIAINIFTKQFHRYEYAYLNVWGTETPSRA